MAQSKSTTRQRPSGASARAAIKQALDERIKDVVKSERKSVRKGVGPSVEMKPFGGVSTMEMSPVSIGNTVRSIKQTVQLMADGVRVIGRDFVQTIGGQTTTITGWALQGGVGLSPIALNATGLRGYFQTYERYKWNRCVAHYITSSPTSLSGDVLIMYHSNHGGPKVDHNSTNFLSYALSTDSALIGPQWTNHSVEVVRGKREWFETDVLNAEDVQHQADGELLVYCKNTTNADAADSPGYLLMDYDITFERRMLNPRISSLPNSQFKWFPTGIEYSDTYAQFDVVSVGFTTTNTYTGVAGTQPVGASVGNIYQVVLDTTNALLTGAPTLANALGANVAFTNTGATNPIAFPLTNGVTLYACAASVTGVLSYVLYPTYESVFAGNCLKFNSAGAQTLTCPAIFCCVGSLNTTFTQANIG